MPNDSDRNEPADEEEVIDLSDVRWDDSIVFVVFWVLAFVVFLQFFTRYVLNDSLGWTEEIARYLLIGVTFIGSVMAVRKRSHIAVEFLYRWLPRPLRRVCQAIIDLVCIAFYGGLTWFSYILASKTRQAMVSIDVPKALVYWIVVASFAAMTLYAVRIAWKNLSTGSSPLIDPEKYADTVKPID